MTLTKHTSTITLITLFLFITTCTTDNSITGNSDQSLAKPTGVLDSNSPESDDDDLTPVDIYINRLIGWVLTEYVHHELLQCSIDELGEFGIIMHDQLIHQSHTTLGTIIFLKQIKEKFILLVIIY